MFASTHQPCVTFMLKGLINSGKSTLFNGMFSCNLSAMSIKRQTMVQVLLSEAADPSMVDDPKEVHAEISHLNNINYQATSQLSGTYKEIDNIPEFKARVSGVNSLLPHLDNVGFQFVDSVSVVANFAFCLTMCVFRLALTIL